jgi:hypothetical protein
MIDKSAPFVISENVIGTRVEDEIVLLDFDAGKYFGLKGSAVRMWELLEARETPEAIVHALMLDFDVVSEAAVRDDVESTLQRLLDAELIRQT